jgi:hypothetical protein
MSVDKRGLAHAVKKGRRRHRERLGADPTVCYMHSGEAPRGATHTGIAGLEVRVLETVLRGHVWLVRELDGEASVPPVQARLF